MGIANEIDTTYTQNRELSWLKFNERVLAEAADVTVPLYERLKFVAIFASNLDEFFMIRVGSLFELSRIESNKIDNKSLLRPSEQLKQIFSVVRPMYMEQEASFLKIKAALRKCGLNHLPAKKFDEDERAFIETYFTEKVGPLLSPQIIDLHHPFPHLLNKALYVTVLLRRKKKTVLGIIPVPSALPRLLFLNKGDSVQYILLEQIILEYVDKVFTQYTVIDRGVIAVTRNADISPDDEPIDVDEDYLSHMKNILKKRGRLSPVRLEIQSRGDSLFRANLEKSLDIKPSQTFVTQIPLDFSYVFALADKFNEQQQKLLMYPRFEPLKTWGPFGRKSPVMQYVQTKDVLINYPYQSFDSFLQLMKEAAYDPNVISIKMTIYRIGKSRAKLINYLITAAELGKDVTVMMELKARFDEENNINWAQSLTDAGCNILYGFEGYKVHAKICMITYKDGESIKTITQIGTGNYNAKTAAIYTDLSLITSNENIGADAAAFFRNMGIANLEGSYKYLLVAPFELKQKLLNCIGMEVERARCGGTGRIVLKMNSLTDRQLIDALAKASQDGVKIDLIIRGICCLLPGIAGKTDNIRVSSIVGRFLEHSRIFCFGEGDDMDMFISSADWMTRNTQKRVEIACPIYDKELKKSIYDALQIMLSDNVKGRRLQSDGNYIRLDDEKAAFDSQQYFLELYGAVAKS